MSGDWYLVLMIWGDRYSDEHCNKLIRQAMTFSTRCRGAVIFTDRMNRAVDPRARLIPIPEDFSDPSMKVGGLPVKLSMFEVEGLEEGDTCVYVDLDSVIIGSLDPVAALSKRAPLWTIPTFPRPFSWWSRLIWRLTNRKSFRFGNSSTFVYLNKYEGNPTEQFRRNVAAGTLPQKLMHDDRFIGWSSQDVVRGLPTSLVVNFRYEFLLPTLWMGHLMARLRRKTRASIALVTFAGPMTKPEIIFEMDEGSQIVDHHQRIGYWDSEYTSGVREKILSAWKI